MNTSSLLGTPCRCRSPVRYRAYRLACLECAADCCPACTFLFESAPYCAACAASILELPLGEPIRAGPAA